MKLIKSLVVISLACGTLWAQAPANQNNNNTKKTPTPPPAHAAAQPATKPATAPAKPAAAAATKPAPTAAKSTATPAKTAAKPTPAAKTQAHVEKPAPAPKPVAKKPVAPIPTKAAPVAAKKAPKPAPAAAPKPASAKEATTSSRVSASNGKMRDPFVSPVVRTSTGAIGAGCETGKRCLVVDQIVLKGIVKSQSGYIAVVENPAKRAYFMRENDPVFNGKVMKITGDTVVFQESVMDNLGKQSEREVVKKVNAPIV